MDNLIFNRIRNIFFSHVVFLFILDPANAMDWTIHPGIQLKETFSDNITLSSNNKKTAFVTDISPGISVKGISSVSSFDLNYRMQNIHNAGGDSGIDIKNQLQMNTNYEFIANKLYMDSSSSISQQNISNRQTSSNNNSGGGNDTTVTTFKLSPYWTPHFNGYAVGDFRVTYDTVETDKSVAGSGKLETNTFSQNFKLASGHRFSYFNWSLAFNNSKSDNSSGNDVKFQDSALDLSFAFNRKFNAFTQIGQSNNSFSSNSNTSKNGISYTFGGQWQPSRRYSIKAGYGNNSFVTVDISPFNRLHWVTTYSNNDIGLNIDDTLDTSLNYRTRRSIWTFTFQERTATVQRQLLNQQVFTTTNSFNQQQQNIVQSQGVRFNNQLPSLSNEVFVTKTALLAASFQTGKSDISADIFMTRRNFEITGVKEKLAGFSASWKWNFSNRTNVRIRSSWQKTKSSGSGLFAIAPFSDKRFDVRVGLTRNILSRLTGNIQYRFVDQSSNGNLNNYSANTISASLRLQY